MGAGFATEDPTIYTHYKVDDDPTKLRAVHNAYFQVLAEHGFVGLAIFIIMLAMAIWNCRWVTKRPSHDQYWLAYLAGMMETALIGYAVGAFALSVAYYDVFLVLIVVSSIIKLYVQRRSRFFRKHGRHSTITRHCEYEAFLSGQPVTRDCSDLTTREAVRPSQSSGHFPFSSGSPNSINSAVLFPQHARAHWFQG